MSIELKNVTYTYSPGTAYESHALKDVSLVIPDGQFIGIIGHTGSGKSTLIQHLNALVQPTAAMIVLGGTFGAAFIAFPMSTAIQGFKDVKLLFGGHSGNEDLITEICGYAAKARKNGIISLEQDAQNHKDRFMKKAISLSVDGVEPKDIKELMEIELGAFEEHA